MTGRPWSPTNSSALLSVPSLTVCRTAAATRGFLSLPLSKAVLLVGSVIPMLLACALCMRVQALHLDRDMHMQRSINCFHHASHLVECYNPVGLGTSSSSVSLAAQA